MSFFDYIPGVSSVVRLAQGDTRGAGIDMFDPITHGTIDAGQGAKDELMNGYTSAINNLNVLAKQQKDFQMKGLQQAENYYLPAQQMTRAVYGDPGALRK